MALPVSGRDRSLPDDSDLDLQIGKIGAGAIAHPQPQTTRPNEAKIIQFKDGFSVDACHEPRSGDLEPEAMPAPYGDGRRPFVNARRLGS